MIRCGRRAVGCHLFAVSHWVSVPGKFGIAGPVLLMLKQWGLLKQTAGSVISAFAMEERKTGISERDNVQSARSAPDGFIAKGQTAAARASRTPQTQPIKASLATQTAYRLLELPRPTTVLEYAVTCASSLHRFPSNRARPSADLGVRMHIALMVLQSRLRHWAHGTRLRLVCCRMVGWEVCRHGSHDRARSIGQAGRTVGVLEGGTSLSVHAGDG